MVETGVRFRRDAARQTRQDKFVESIVGRWMDFITHTLVGTGAMRMMTPRADWRARLAPAAFLGSTLMDFDSWLALMGPDYYGRYHRVVSHSIVGLLTLSLVSAAFTWWLARRGKWERFGWYITPNLAQDESVESEPPPFVKFLAVCLVGAALHWIADVITGFGNMQPFWPWSNYDASLRAVFSFDVFLFSLTFGWHLVTRNWNFSLGRERAIGAGYFAIATCYVVGRLIWGEPTFI